MNRDELILQIKEKLEDIINDLKVKRDINLLILFGSYARGNYSDNSDIDLAILFKENNFNKNYGLNMRIELSNTFSSSLKKECDIILINQSPPLLKYQIVKYGDIIYSDSNFSYNSFYSRVLKEYFDFKHYQDLHYSLMLKRINLL